MQQLIAQNQQAVNAQFVQAPAAPVQVKNVVDAEVQQSTVDSDATYSRQAQQAPAIQFIVPATTPQMDSQQQIQIPVAGTKKLFSDHAAESVVAIVNHSVVVVVVVTIVMDRTSEPVLPTCLKSFHRCSVASTLVGELVF